MTGNKFPRFANTGRSNVACRMSAMVVLLAIWLTAPAFGQDRVLLKYNELVRVLLASPSDICLENGEDEHCMLIQKTDGSAWPGLEFPVEEVSIPSAAHGSLVAGRHGDDFGWFVYDTSVEDYIVSPVEKEEALDIYNITGAPEPEFVDALDARAVLGVASRNAVGFSNIVLGILGALTVVALGLFVIAALWLWWMGSRLSLRRRDVLRRVLWGLAVFAASTWALLLLVAVLWSGS